MRASDVTAAAAVVAVVAGLAVLPDSARPEVDEVDVRTVPVERAELVCPPMPAEGDATAAVTAPIVGADSDLQRKPVQVRSDGSTIARIGRRGEVWRSGAEAVGSGFSVRAVGALAAGLSGLVTADLDGRRVAGRATAACVSPASSWWFVGAGSTVGREGTLVLTNASSGVAVVDLVFHGPKGLLEDVDSEEIALEAGAQRALPLADFVPGVEDVAITVRARQGRVAAAVSESVVDAAEPLGVDFLPAAAAPDRQAVVTGLPAGRGRRELTVVNTGELETVVDVEVLGASGAFTPTDFDVFTVPGGAVVTRDVTDITGAKVSGLRLSADQPITASVRSTTRDGDDVSFTSAGSVLDEGAAVPIPRGVEPTVVLSAVNDSPATAEVTVFDASGEQIGSERLEVNGGQTIAWPVRGNGRPASLVVRSEQGEQLTGVVRWTGDGGASSTPLLPLRTTLRRPSVSYDPVGP